jgi:hypothetical protein
MPGKKKALSYPVNYRSRILKLSSDWVFLHFYCTEELSNMAVRGKIGLLFLILRIYSWKKE